jgi:hypothetical protein
MALEGVLEGRCFATPIKLGAANSSPPAPKFLRSFALKRNIVGLGVQVWVPGFRARRRRRRGTRTSRRRRSWQLRFLARAEELNVFGDYTKLGPFLAGLFVVPCIQLETAFDKNRAAFLQILAGNLG